MKTVVFMNGLDTPLKGFPWLCPGIERLLGADVCTNSIDLISTRLKNWNRGFIGVL